MNAESIARALGGRRSGDQWIARCPAHHDRRASLAVRDGDHVPVLVHCFGGCPQEAVIAELRARDLWPEPTPRAAWRGGLQ